jgi:hypothetical protein
VINQNIIDEAVVSYKKKPKSSQKIYSRKQGREREKKVGDNEEIKDG